MSFIEIDGSTGEGGGQILRSSLALSALTGQPFRLKKVRANRKKPGLMRQHLTALNAATEICGAEVKGAELRSHTVEFVPNLVQGGRYHFAIGTAGSACLVLQTVLPPLLLAKTKSHVVLEGGTHNPFAPPYDFLAETFIPLLGRMGAQVKAKLVQPGFFPAGGGRVEIEVEPTEKLQPIDLTERGQVLEVCAQVLLANLPEAIGLREMEYLQQDLDLAPERVELVQLTGPGPGNAVLAKVRSESHTEVFCGIGQKGIPAGRVVNRLARRVTQYLTGEEPVGVHLADQLIIPLAMAGGGAFKTTGISAHTATNIGVVERFLDVKIVSESLQRGAGLVTFGA